MPGTVAGAAKTKAKNLAKNPNFYQEVGSKGGKVKVPKGFAKMSQMKRSAAGKKGGSVPKGRFKYTSPSKFDYYLPVMRFVYIVLFFLIITLIGYLGLKASGAIK